MSNHRAGLLGNGSGWYALGYHVYHVGGEDQPRKGASDRAVLAHASMVNQAIATSNHDMILLCAEEDESVIWFDPRGRGMNRRETVVRAVGGIEEWESMLGVAEGPVCIRVMKTKAEVLSLERAAHLVRSRIVAKERKARQRGRPTPQNETAR